jgi:superfamily II DNA or RNA helicase
VLDELQEHLIDRHLHVVAPPGSGKTVLGLEVALRLNKPVLILAPTLAIRNQWVQRFCELFLQTDKTPDWISCNIREPKFMTVSTYQGLHSACNNLKNKELEENETEEEFEEENKRKSTNKNLEAIIALLKKQKINTIVADEAHHLKNEWWQTLIKIKNELNPVIVGLTATPPYDVTATEWQRYIDLNGAIDTEISVPELIIENDLCPHQDYLYFSLPTETEKHDIFQFRQNINNLFDEVRKDETLIQAIENHKVWRQPEENLDWIYTNMSIYATFLIFLNANGKAVSEKHLEIVGDKKLKIPTLDFHHLEILLDYYLYKNDEDFANFEEHKINLENKLKRHNAIEQKRIDFGYSNKVNRNLITSISKLDSISKIVDFEYNNLKNNLRMVILSDFIRKEFFVNTSENNLILNKLGVLPIFEKLRRENQNGKKIGILTGTMIIIPKSAKKTFETETQKNGIAKIECSPLPFDSNYLLVKQSEELNHCVVHLVTQIFQQGEIEILIGTKSLLGEGWDAPAINSLILASFVGSFVLSNQMRGRAIRTQSNNPQKTGNIWHLVCIDPTSTDGGEDFNMLKRRFRSFVGISFDEKPTIENGTGRLKIPENFCSETEIENKNAEMMRFAADRENLKNRWQTALKSGITLVEEIKIPFAEEKEYRQIKSMYFDKTIKSLLVTLGMTLLGFVEGIFQGIGRIAQKIKTLQDLYILLAIIFGGGIVVMGRQTFKTLKLYFKYRDIAKDIQNIGDALLNALIKERIIQPNDNLAVNAVVDKFGAVYCHLDGGTTFDKSTFITYLQEIIQPIDNPRYLIIRKSYLLLIIRQQDYHSVPEILGKNKRSAEYFSNQWQRLVGKCELIFTRNIDGRKILLKARMQSLSAQLDEKIERVNKWV